MRKFRGQGHIVLTIFIASVGDNSTLRGEDFLTSTWGLGFQGAF